MTCTQPSCFRSQGLTTPHPAYARLKPSNLKIHYESRIGPSRKIALGPSSQLYVRVMSAGEPMRPRGRR